MAEDEAIASLATEGDAGLAGVEPPIGAEQDRQLLDVGPGDSLGAFEKRLSLRRPALRPVKLGQIDQAHGDIGVIGPLRLLADGEGTLVERLGLAVAASRIIEGGEVVERCGDVGVVGPLRLFLDRQRALDEGLGLGVPALLAIELPEVVER